jgi:hypothetical protein
MYVLGKYILGNLGRTTTNTETKRLARAKVGIKAAATALNEDGPLGCGTVSVKTHGCRYLARDIRIFHKELMSDVETVCMYIPIFRRRPCHCWRPG